MDAPSSLNPNDTIKRLQTREARIGIIGLGHVGLPLALLFRDDRFEVTGFDIDQVKVNALNAVAQRRAGLERPVFSYRGARAALRPQHGEHAAGRDREL
jgi:hypothetical protein